MPRLAYAILALSLVANGGMAGLIAGHLLTTKPVCQCDRRPDRRDEGPYPTGWVTPDAAPKPKGASR